MVTAAARRLIGSALAVPALVALVACGGSTTTTSTPTTAPPAETSAAPAAPGDSCALLSADEINQVLGTEFGEGEAASDEATQTANCTYTVTDDSSGVEVPVAIVVVAESLTDGADSYATNLDLAVSYFGNQPEATEVPGAEKAYIVTNEGTNSPVVGMLVGDRFVQVQVGVQDATSEQGLQLAETLAANAA
jgi:hypothetical protein